MKMAFTFLLLISWSVWAQTPPAEPVASPPAQPSPPGELPTPPALDASGAPMTEMQNSVQPEAMVMEFKWDPTGRRDPFKPFKAPRVLRPDSLTPTDPLTLLDLNQVQLVGILWNTQKPRAVIQDTTGNRYTIFKKTKLGTNSGYVAEIREGEIVVVETFDDGFGNVVKEMKTITLNKPVPTNPGNASNNGG